jgi:hypothetical protein
VVVGAALQASAMSVPHIIVARCLCVSSTETPSHMYTGNHLANFVQNRGSESE